MQFEHDVVVITGGTAGIGRATAHAFAEQGAAVCVLARNEERLAETCKELALQGAQCLGIPTDVSDPTAVELAADKVESMLGPITIWVNNAMTSVLAEAHKVTPAEYKRVTEVTYLGYVYGTLTALKRMENTQGKIIQVGSALAYRAIPLQSAYCAAKHAIRGFTDSVRCELLHSGSSVHISSVHLPAVNTPQFEWVRSYLPHSPQPVPPIYSPTVAAHAVLSAAAGMPREVLVGLPTALIILANKVAPWAVEWYLAKTAYGSQQTNENTQHSAGNLFNPVAGQFGATGKFSDRSTARAAPLWFTSHLGKVLSLGGLAMLAILLGFLY